MSPVTTRHGRSAGPSGLRGFIIRHPVLTLVLCAHLGLWGAIATVLFLGAPPRPMSTLGAVLGLAVPALALTATLEGKVGVRDLLGRSLRWRVRWPWYLFAVLTVPFGSLVLAPLFAGPMVLDALGENWALIFSVFLPQVLINLVTVQIFEELGWTGFAQHRVQRVHGALKTSLLLGVVFATVHFPMYLIGMPLTTRSVLSVVALQVIVIPLALFIRVLLTWTYNRTGFSVLLAAILHASFNAANDADFLPELVPGPVAMMLPLAVIVVLAVTVMLLSKGRLGDHPERQRTQSPSDLDRTTTHVEPSNFEESTSRPPPPARPGKGFGNNSRRDL